MSIQTNNTGLATILSRFSLRIISLLGRGTDRLREPARIANTPVTTKPPLTITEYGYSNGAVMLNLAGQLNATSAEYLFSQAQATYEQGSRRLVLNLDQVSEIELSGTFVLGNIARLYAGLPLINPEDGWLALKQMSEPWPFHLPSQVKLVATEATWQAMFAQTPIAQYLPVYPNKIEAFEAFR